MVTVNGKEIHWIDAPKDWYLTDIKFHVLWKNEETGAMFVLVKYPVSDDRWELPHTHGSNQFGFVLSGEWERPDGTRSSWSESNYGFGVRRKGDVHGPPKGMKVNKETIILQYFDGPSTKNIA
jgi:hypothetical protein